MTRRPPLDRRTYFQTVLRSLLQHREFTLREVQIAPVDGKSDLRMTRRVIDELLEYGAICLMEPAEEERYRWKVDPEQFDAAAWLAGATSGTQLTSMPQEDRPRERLLRCGASELRTAELLAILIRSGRPGESALQSGERISNHLSERLDLLPDLGLSELRAVSKAVSEPAYCQIMAGIELGRRVAAASEDSLRHRIRITSPATAIRFCLSRFSRLAMDAKQEEFHMVTLDTKNQPIACHQITVGTLRNSLVHPREVFRPAIRDAANCILVLHNHPSGDPTPSDQDLRVTERLESAADIIGISVIDHIIVAGDRALSIQEWRSGSSSSHQ